MPEEANIDNILERARGFMEAELILTAHEMDIFSLIGEKSLTAAEVAKKTASSERGVTILLDALSATSLLNIAPANLVFTVATLSVSFTPASPTNPAVSGFNSNSFI